MDELIINNISSRQVLFWINYEGVFLEGVRITSVSPDKIIDLQMYIVGKYYLKGRISIQ